MAELTVDMTYGQALYGVAADLDKIDTMLEEGKELVALFRREPELYEFISTPIISAAEKKNALNGIFKGRIMQEFLNLLFVLIDKGRTKHFEKIIQRFQYLINEKQGFTIGTIFSVNPLTEVQLQSFEEKTAKLLQKNVKLENKTDSSILGGVRIFIEGKVIDATIKKRLNDLKESLK